MGSGGVSVVESAEPARTRWERHVARWDGRRRRLERCGRRVASVRLASAMVLVLALAASARWPGATAAWQALAASCLVVFVAGVVVHRRLRTAVSAAIALRDVAQREHLRAVDRWRELPRDGSGLEADEGLAADLGLTGRASVFQAVSRCATAFGERTLARWLTTPDAPADVAERQAAVRELAGRGLFRRRLEADGAGARRDGTALEPLSRCLAGTSLHERQPWLAPVARAVGILIVGQLVVELGTPLPTAFWPCVGLQVLLFAWSGRALVAEYEELLHHEADLEAWRAMLRRAGAARFRAPRLSSLRSRLHPGGRPAARHVDDLRSILAALGLRHGLLHALVNAFLPWDIHHTARLARWRRVAGAQVADWFDVLGELEALSSLGAHAATSSVLSWPRLDADGPAWLAEGLVHPLLPAGRAVANDVRLDDETGLLLVTGSNMSGKSTLLRAVGVATLLAQAGGAAPARRLALRPCRLRTSIHVTDALDEGVSLFYAEVRRLKRILEDVAAAEEARAQPAVLFLVDEVLRGTNTRERLIASRAIIRRLAASRSVGLVTSHDLSLVELEGAVPGLRNVHFRERVDGGRMTFDYRLRPGPVETTNALVILRLEGIDVDDGDAPEG